MHYKMHASQQGDAVAKQAISIFGHILVLDMENVAGHYFVTICPGQASTGVHTQLWSLHFNERCQ